MTVALEPTNASRAFQLRSSAVASDEVVDQNGRVLGPRAQQTRQRLLEATEELLQQGSLRDLRVSEIARKVGASPATFYQYFRDVEDAVLRLSEQASREVPEMLKVMDGSWKGDAGLDRARLLVDAFIRHWDRHQAVLRVRNLASDEGDEAFRNVRSHAMLPVLTALAERVEDAQERGEVSAGHHPHAAAAAMAAILERLAAYRRELEVFGVTRDHLVETSALIIHRIVTGS